MQIEKYTALADSQHKIYEFLSEGPKGTIKKVVHYQLLGGNLYNLAFGDWNELEQKMDDIVRSNNHDREKILATVAFTVIDFMSYYPQAVLFAQGSTPAKTRLYQMGISKNWAQVKHLFTVEGIINGNLQPLEQGRNYEALY